VAAVNNLVEKEELVAWSRMAGDLRDNTVTKLLHAMEQGALALARGASSSSTSPYPAQLDVRASDMGERLQSHIHLTVNIMSVFLPSP